MLPACATTSPAAEPTEPDPRAEQVEALRIALADVAAAQSTADDTLRRVLDAIRGIDEAVAAVSAVDTLDDALAGYDARHAMNATVSTDGLREVWFDVAVAAEDAHVVVQRAEDLLDDPWELRYVEAQDDVLAAVRAYAESADRLSQIVQQHWPTYLRVDEQLVSFAERRWFFRSTQEAADALAVEADTLFADLRVAQAQLNLLRTERLEAASAVNTATADAVQIWESRPTDQPTLPNG